LEIGLAFFPWLAWTAVLLFYISHCGWDDRHMLPQADFSVEMGSCELLFRLASNCDLPDLSLMLAGMTSSLKLFA
jgi:hypothetical protein